MMLAAYHAHLAGRVRYYGPLARSICASDLLPALRTEQRIWRRASAAQPALVACAAATRPVRRSRQSAVTAGRAGGAPRPRDRRAGGCCRDRTELRHLGATAFVGERSADGTRSRTAAPAARGSSPLTATRLERWRGSSTGCSPGARARMQRRLEHFRPGTVLDRPPEIHHDDLVGDVAHHREVVRDEQVREPELVLQVAPRGSAPGPGPTRRARRPARPKSRSRG